MNSTYEFTGSKSEDDFFLED